MEYTVPIELVVDAKRAARETKVGSLGSDSQDDTHRQNPLRVSRVRRHDAGTTEAVPTKRPSGKSRSAA